MNVVLITLLITPFLYVFAVILSFTNAGVPSLSKEERGMAFESISDLIKNRPPIFRKKLCQSWLILAGMCIMLAVGYCRVGHIEQYTMRSDRMSRTLHVCAIGLSGRVLGLTRVLSLLLPVLFASRPDIGGQVVVDRRCFAVAGAKNQAPVWAVPHPSIAGVDAGR